MYRLQTGWHDVRNCESLTLIYELTVLLLHPQQPLHHARPQKHTRRIYWGEYVRTCGLLHELCARCVLPRPRCISMWCGPAHQYRKYPCLLLYAPSIRCVVAQESLFSQYHVFRRVQITEVHSVVVVSWGPVSDPVDLHKEMCDRAGARVKDVCGRASGWRFCSTAITHSKPKWPHEKLPTKVSALGTAIS